MESTTRLKQAVKDYRAGKAEAFTQLYEESSRYIYTCIHKVMGGNDNATDAICDIMQDTYVEISKSISQLENENSFLTWAGIIATRKSYAWLKKNKKYVLMDEEDDTFENLADNDNIIPEEVMQDREKQRIIRGIIDTELTEMQRLCIVAYYYNEQKQWEIAQDLGIPENTVKTNLSRAKVKIKAGVLDVEEKQGTKLYSVAPLMLLFFKEEASACVVPASVTAGVKGAVSMAGKAGAKTLLGKVASASAKAKITIGAIGAAVVVSVGSLAYVAMQDKEESIEQVAGEIASNEMGNGEINGSSEAEAPETTATPEPENEPESESEPEVEEVEPNLTEYYEAFCDLEYSNPNVLYPISLESFEKDEKYIHLIESVDIYNQQELCIGHTKPDVNIQIYGKNDEWYMIWINESKKRFVKIEDIDDNFRIPTEEELYSEYEQRGYSEQDVEALVGIIKNRYLKDIYSNTGTSQSVSTANNQTSQSQVEPPVVQNPVTPEQNNVETPVEEPAETGKYTPEEAIAVYRSIMEGAGINWNPDIKEFASWGTGFIELRVGGPEWAGNASVDSCINYGNGDGVPWTQYYLEVTGSDENYVYYTKWGCD